ncbi:MBOAT family O-acyltransferase [Sphingobacterium sp. WOUb80]|uniref:MBOAT family O-acyltransferase n=1 Tax=Sphingobacterium sp. WOUb80 TaxID=3234028 RepID=UPI003CE82091
MTGSAAIHFNWEAFWAQFLYDRESPLLFNNGFFVYFFFLFIILFYVLRNHQRARTYVFCLFSLYFFYKASGVFVLLVLLSAIIDFVLSNRIYNSKNKGGKKILLLCSIVFNLSLLIYFKYTNFFVELSNLAFHTHLSILNVLLPVGISFYTFENISYSIDVYKGEFKPTDKFSEYLLFLSFFPKLVMGPIVRAKDFVPQIIQPYQISEGDLKKGFYLIFSGLFKKLIISDYITLNLVNYIFDDPKLHTGLENLIGVYGYAFVIYCDFSGYSDVAIGIALWLGFRIPPNFLSPYQSKNITEFWRRWHISLSSWLRDYLYIPLGGNRNWSLATLISSLLFISGIFVASTHLFHLSYALSACIVGSIIFILFLPALLTREQRGLAASANLLTTMLLGGFWHGASWNFILWGSFHGIGLAIHKIWLIFPGKRRGAMNDNKVFNVLSLLLTFHFVCFTWIFFKAVDVHTALAMIEQIVYNFDANSFFPFYENYHTVVWLMFIACILHFIPDNYADKVMSSMGKVSLVYYLILFFVFILIYSFFKSSEQVLPIYLQF